MSLLQSGIHLDQRELGGSDNTSVIDALARFSAFLITADVEEKKHGNAAAAKFKPTPELHAAIKPLLLALGAIEGKQEYNVWRIYESTNLTFSPGPADIVPARVGRAFIADKPLQIGEYTHLTRKELLDPGTEPADIIALRC
ncbi:hypothetical protein LOZ55_000771 [Ophidiomyces ophidiicola]|nr:hypothetical protein LOZ55_000771 [Ophidiomyces ophidiicola]